MIHAPDCPVAMSGASDDRCTCCLSWRVVVLATEQRRIEASKALERCLSVMLRMIPDACTEHGLEPTTNDEHDKAIRDAARVLYGDDSAKWPPGVRQAAEGLYP